ncbi:M13 family peptidase [Mycoplasma sp. ES3157-GEN-MYC]|uniref:M13 family peptidase n=1 Tax=Mycoplasma miroungigenitalium TaxID=754515 RepID=A0A6M4JDN2_9MOLU|nr:M13-type metalloendopeptidase [Mycoplasma miroungigenitalium]MBU4690104.1 M13 family peptidase [Mycoplasma miroungigenitalium]MBU4691376.1 M13 family peptidase [Mycoplasma miroungigenitalium]QJR43212.1 M13 family peptidase [Mycoplasma miroungigenitalium]
MRKEIKDNLFESVNHDWLQNAKIPADRSYFGEFSELDIKNEKRIARLAKQLVKRELENKLIDQNLVNFAKYYSLTSNFEKREKAGTAPLTPYVNELLGLKNIDEFNDYFVKFALRDYALPVIFHISTDLKNSNNQILICLIASHILPDKSHYENPETKSKFLKVAKKMFKKLLAPFIPDVKKVNNVIKLALQYDELIAKYSLTSLQKAKYVELYKPYAFEKIVKQTENFKIENILSQLINKPIDKIVFFDDNFAKNIDKLFNPKHFERLKAWLVVNLVKNFSGYLDDKTRVNATLYKRFISGQSKASNKNKDALNLALEYFKMPVGLHYGQNYFGVRAKKNVENMIKHMIKIYKKNLENNDWLSDKTKEKAIIKLNNLGVHVGFPKEIEPFYKDLKVVSDSIIENVFEFNKIINRYSFNKFNEKPNKNYWSMSPATVNAYFNPSMNHIVFPAAVLDGAFYSLKHSSSENYGGIGAVIAHEISHAFDNNGALFDENGEMNTWWTEEDFATFKDKTKSMIELFDGLDTKYGKCNGTLTVSENIADAGGLACALEAAKQEPDYNPKEFFINWARVWKWISKPEMAVRLLETDTHAPCELRANIQAANTEEFTKTFDVKPGDKMYIAPEKRVKIW